MEQLVMFVILAVVVGIPAFIMAWWIHGKKEPEPPVSGPCKVHGWPEEPPDA